MDPSKFNFQKLMQILGIVFRFTQKLKESVSKKVGSAAPEEALEALNLWKVHNEQPPEAGAEVFTSTGNKLFHY